MGSEIYFLPADNIKVFYKMIVSLWVCIARHAQSTQNKRFTIYLQYVKENVKNAVDILPADKHRRFLQTDTIIFRCAISLQHLKKVVSDAVDFLHADKHESLLQIDIMILMEMFKYSQSSQNSKFTMSTISQKRS